MSSFVKQEFFTRNNLNRTSLYDQQSLSIPGGIFPTPTFLFALLSPSLSLSLFSLRPRPFLSPPSRTTCSFLLQWKKGELFQTSSLSIRDFTRKENFSSYPDGLIINKGGFGLSIQAPRNLLHYIQWLVLFAKVQGLLSSHHQDYLAISLPWEQRI